MLNSIYIELNAHTHTFETEKKTTNSQAYKISGTEEMNGMEMADDGGGSETKAEIRSTYSISY